jgi:hypothetical protein
MLILSGLEVYTPDRVMAGASLALDAGRIVSAGPAAGITGNPPPAGRLDLTLGRLYPDRQERHPGRRSRPAEYRLPQPDRAGRADPGGGVGLRLGGSGARPGAGIQKRPPRGWHGRGRGDPRPKMPGGDDNCQGRDRLSGRRVCVDCQCVKRMGLVWKFLGIYHEGTKSRKRNSVAALFRAGVDLLRALEP